MTRPEALGVELVRFVLGRSAPDTMAPVGLPSDRALLYRGMVIGRLRDTIEAALPRAIRSLGLEHARRWFARWLEAVGPSTPFIRDVPVAFAEWLERRVDERSSAILIFERTAWTRADVVATIPRTTDLSFERAAVLNPTLARVRLGYDAHRDDVRAEEMTAGSYDLAISRRVSDDVVLWLELSILETSLVSWLGSGLPMTRCAAEVASELDRPVDECFVRELASACERLVDAEVILGGQAQNSRPPAGVDPAHETRMA